MTPETAIYLYGFASGAIGLLIAYGIVWFIARQIARDEDEFTGGEL